MLKGIKITLPLIICTIYNIILESPAYVKYFLLFIFLREKFLTKDDIFNNRIL
ncbi:hypothetical protein CLOAM0124 [Candidatus Cloacimonas acidaminovorans str. Evry]|uniref:Uncharacterized protein n=1 Tax=Cloacimonas acidaminovorans (strain Evry) TaxID=459349 RepID=B0VIX4_CLOAI|nr:hypothetical protein CLOAM0124 [Candidatus Cloacimonas acidaminovorans str. Evry]